MNSWKNSLSCWCFVYDVLHRVYWPCICVLFYFFLQVFIPIYRGFERRWELAVTSTCLALKLWFFTIHLLPDLIIVLWRTNFKSIPYEKEQGLQQCYCYLCLVVETKIAEMVVSEFVAVHFVHCPLSTLVKLLLMTIASDDVASDDVSSGALLQTRFFRCTSSDAFLQTHSSRCF